MASGNLVTMVKEDKKTEMYQIDVGGILPGQKVLVEIHIVQPLTIVSGAYNYVFPMTYFPRTDVDQV